MDLGMTSQVREVPNLRHRIRQLRWFKTTFRHHAGLVSQRYGLAFDIDDTRLTKAFLDWAEAFAATKSHARLDRRDFVTFAAGILLRELLRSNVAAAQGSSDAASSLVPDGARSIPHAWPEGFLYTNYCVCILAAVFEQEGMPLTLPALADDLRTWWSYRENACEDPAQAVAFLDLFIGNEPNWFTPDAVQSRGAMKRALAAGVVPEPARV